MRDLIFVTVRIKGFFFGGNLYENSAGSSTKGFDLRGTVSVGKKIKGKSFIFTTETQVAISSWLKRKGKPSEKRGLF